MSDLAEHNDDGLDHLRAQYRELIKERDKRREKVDVIQAKRAKLRAQQGALREKLLALNAELHEARGGDDNTLYKLEMQSAALSRALKGKTGAVT